MKIPKSLEIFYLPSPTKCLFDAIKTLLIDCLRQLGQGKKHLSKEFGAVYTAISNNINSL